jgi:serine/threonine protein kinase
VVDELQPEDPREIGPYRLTGVLGSGGMGRVYLGVSPGGRKVAVKVIRADLAADPEFRARFRREITAARTISGIYTAAVVDADLDGRVPWLAIVFVDGPSFAETVTTRGPLAAESLRALAAGLAEALAAIHGAGLVHRDLKPSNILLADDGPKVIDFGIARAADATVLTHTGQYVGSPGFLSPEQAEGQEITPATDIFSLRRPGSCGTGRGGTARGAGADGAGQRDRPRRPRAHGHYGAGTAADSGGPRWPEAPARWLVRSPARSLARPPRPVAAHR